MQRCRYNKKVVQEQVQRWCRACADMQRRWCRVGAERGRYVVEICRGAEVQRCRGGQMVVQRWCIMMWYRGAEMQRCRGADMANLLCGAEVVQSEVVQRWCRGAGAEVVQRCRGAEVQRCRGAEVQRGTEVQRSAVECRQVQCVQRCRGAEVQMWWCTCAGADVVHLCWCRYGTGFVQK